MRALAAERLGRIRMKPQNQGLQALEQPAIFLAVRFSANSGQSIFAYGAAEVGRHEAFDFFGRVPAGQPVETGETFCVH
jgi:hypothetical protein